MTNLSLTLQEAVTISCHNVHHLNLHFNGCVTSLIASSSLLLEESVLIKCNFCFHLDLDQILFQWWSIVLHLLKPFCQNFYPSRLLRENFTANNDRENKISDFRTIYLLSLFSLCIT